MVMMPVPHHRTIEIRQSPWKSSGLVAAGVALVATSYFVTTLTTGRSGRTLSDVGLVIYGTVGWLGVLFFGAATAVALWRAVAMRGSTVTVCADGIWDRRVTGSMVAWSSVTGLSTWRHAGQSIIVLAIDPVVESRIELTGITRWTRRANRSLSIDGLAIATNGLDMSHAGLYALVESRLAAEHSSSRTDAKERTR